MTAPYNNEPVAQLAERLSCAEEDSDWETEEEDDDSGDEASTDLS